MKNFFTFRTMITPWLLTAVFVIGVVACIITGLIFMGGDEEGSTVSGLLLILLGPIGVRIYTEMLMVVFGIHSELVEMRNDGAIAR